LGNNKDKHKSFKPAMLNLKIEKNLTDIPF